ncbi:MAG: ABC transporter ATP-binding protein [Micromonosporaceae bacterium]
MVSDLLTYAGVCFSHGAEPVLTDIDIQMPDVGITALAGPSGSGKSTLLRLANRLLLPDAGVVSYRSDDVAAMHPPTLRRRLGMVFQRPTPFPGTVRENLSVAAPELSDTHARGLMERVNLDPALLGRTAADLSGGELNRMCLARALATEPEALLMDEPTAALDPPARIALERLARELADSGIPLVWVTHDLDQLRRVADRVVLLMDGRVRFAGSLSQLDAAARADPATARFLADADSSASPAGVASPTRGDGT